MQREPTTIEEQLVLKAIAEELPWGNLPKRLQSTLNSKEEWHRRITEHCIKKRLPWNKCFARKVCKEGEYYEELMRYLRRNLALYPYHLAEHVCRVMRVSPFKYYCDMIFEVMKNEQPYDSIPNFSAADALRLTGIGRNEFIDIMNKCRSKKIMWKLNKSIAKELLPFEPVDFVIEPWWGICLVNFTLEEFKKLSEEEMATIDKICKEETNSFVLFDSEVVKGLYRRGLVYFDVPVYADDRFKVSRLEGFVSNREQMYEDPIEELLYAVFVVLSENSTVAELATTLQADLSQLTAAASFACRLGWAVKIIDPGSILQEKSNTLLTPRSIIIDEADGSNTNMGSNLVSEGNIFPPGDALWTENSSTDGDCSHVAFVVDANITSYLMMGSVSPGLKFHAVTLYEAGKLGYGSIADLCRDLITLEGAKFEGELQEFANHAFSLRCILECITSGGIATEEKNGNESKSTRKEQASSSANDVSFGDEPRDSGTNKSELSKDYEQSVIAGDGSTEPQMIIEGDSSTEPQTGSMGDENPSTAVSEKFNSNYNDPKLGRMFKIDEKSDSVEGSGEKEVKKLRKYRVDILRCESLAALAPATLDRLFHRDYDIIVSMIPLPYSSVLPGSKSPVHFGPPSHSAMTPWMKLVLYTTLCSGPLSVVLMKGQCLRLLPAPLAGCEKALIWSWDGSAIGGLGGKLEGDLVKGSVLLHGLNSLLKYSSVLVQPLSKMDLDEDGMVVTLDVPMPLKNSDGSMAFIGEELGMCTEECSKLNSMLKDISNKMNLWTVGYVRLIRLFKERDPDKFPFDDDKYEWVPLSAEFGIPLFSPKLCRSICKRVISSKLLQSDILNEHQEAMQDLRRKLRDICAEYQATGPTARLLYNKELKDISSTRQLMNYASARWNPLSDPSSPISGAAGENQRLKLGTRVRSRIEVLSFDGSVLRSYSLSPLNEASKPAAEDAAGPGPIRADPDDSEIKEVVLPGVNLLFDGYELRPFEIGACLQARLPVSLIAEASSASTVLVAKQQKA